MSSPSLIVLINLNTYLGGGETLMVRFAEYLQQQDVEFLCVCAAGSYLLADLQRKGIASTAILPIESSPDYYYADRAARQRLVEQIAAKIENRSARLVSFCMRDLYTASALCSRLPRAALVHLILHIQDDMYVGQTILDKIVYSMTGRRQFRNSQAIAFNRRLLSMINRKGGLICMADLIAKVWHKNFGVIIPDDHIVPLPSFVATADQSEQEGNNRRIIWIGRLVDFKIPALLAMIDFLSGASDYTLTVIGDGDRGPLIKRMRERNVDSDRVSFIGEVPYAQLQRVIRGHSIGYAMGTSLIELARFGIPVMVALASYRHRPFARPICGGLFFDQARGCDGSELAIISEDEIETTIENAIGMIEADWNAVARACYEYARGNYSAEKNFSTYMAIIHNAAWLSEAERLIEIPVAPLLRKSIYAISSR
jgi:glycosyltransferase involved in cell wall biosynthesis